jgi:hypothetical protein
MDNPNLEKQHLEKVLNWTLPNLSYFYRDTELEKSITDMYVVGQIIRSATFVDVSAIAAGLKQNVRFVFASSKAAPVYEINPNVAKYKMFTINMNSFFKVLDVYEFDGKTQILLLHIPATGIDFFVKGKVMLRGEDVEQQIVQKSRIKFKTLLTTPVINVLQEKKWLDKTSFPIGLDVNNIFFDLQTSQIPKGVQPLYKAIKKLSGDFTEINEINF